MVAFFDLVKLKNEITVFHSIEAEDKSVAEIMKMLEDTDLGQAFQEPYKLCCLIYTISITTASVERSFSTHKNKN